MAGRSQHYIPRLVLRGFLARRTSRDEYAWVARKTGEIFCGNLEGIAAQRDFYSDPARPGEATLDRQITDYEDRLATLVGALRNLPVGAAADAGVAAEVIAHLTPRAATIRSLFSDALARLLEQAAPVLNDADTMRRFAGLNSPAPTDAFRTEIFEKIKEQLPAAQMGAPMDLIERMAFALARENVDELLEALRPDIQTGLGMMDEMAPERVRVGHQQSLGQSLAPPERMEKLSRLTWHVAAAPEEGVLLPDCVALAYDCAGNPAPYIMASHDEIHVVVMPLTDTRLLVGRIDGAVTPDFGHFNTDAAACSDALIVTAHRSHPLEALVPIIGSRAKAFIAENIDEVVENFAPPAAEAAPLRPGQGFSFDIQCPDWDDQPQIDLLGDWLADILKRLASVWPLQRLEGFTFAFDYEGALASLDTGFGAPLKPSDLQPDEGLSLAMAPAVIRDDVLKARIIMRAQLAQALIGDDENVLRPRALYVLIAQLAHVSLMTLIEDHWPGILLAPLVDNHTQELYRRTHPALFGYFVARSSAPFSQLLEIETELSTEFGDTVARHRESLEAAASAFEQNGDIDCHYQAKLDAAGAILERLARLIGHRHGLDQPGLPAEGALFAILERLELIKWFGLLEADLQHLWLHRGSWPSFEAFSSFTAHAERLLWQLGAMSWRIDDDTYWVQFFPTEGLNAIADLEPAI